MTHNLDALGRMVEQNRSGAYTQLVYSPTGYKLALMNGQTLTKGLVGLPGGGQAVYNSSGLLYYGHADHLGSIKMASTTGRAFSWSLAFAPFAEIYSNSGPIDPDFTGMRSDIGGGIYDFPAREYTYLGRWPSPDPAGLAAADPSNPQSWNRYAYVLNSPCSSIDPLGLETCNLSVSISNQAGVTTPQLDWLKAQIQALLGQGDNGNSVAINFVSPGGDYNLNLVNPNSSFSIGGALGGDAHPSGSTWCPLGFCANTGTVYVGNAMAANGLFTSDRQIGTGLGTVAAHELGHSIGNFGDLNYDGVGGNLMSLGTNPNAGRVSQGFGVSPDKRLTPQQIQALFKACKKKHPKQGSGGGGGATGDGGGWIFWQPINYGQEGNTYFGTGQWIWWPGGGIWRMSVN